MKRYLLLLASGLAVFYSADKFVPWYMNNVMDSSGVTYANVYKVLTENPKERPLRRLTYSMIRDEKIVASEYTAFISLYNSEFGGLVGVPAADDYEKEHYLNLIHEYLELNGEVKCTSARYNSVKKLAIEDNLSYGEFNKPSHNQERFEFVNVEGDNDWILAVDDWRCVDADLNFFSVTDRAMPLFPTI
ncbi:hypothetical protein QL995_17305 [Pseudoalteromonas sp. APC 3358]|uniref:hypothetical protein n=1 Tax=unclassified Pseudoalteromonas TaxID=194690 RepID=UPI00040F4F62|nr:MULTISPECIES: hypothetical protein [unclassified Pseudoalteromonas]MDN3384393.1 hypothetical protein [Pseudoalteromonas sp. APC 3358]